MELTIKQRFDDVDKAFLWVNTMYVRYDLPMEIEATMQHLALHSRAFFKDREHLRILENALREEKMSYSILFMVD